LAFWVGCSNSLAAERRLWRPESAESRSAMRRKFVIARWLLVRCRGSPLCAVSRSGTPVFLAPTKSPIGAVPTANRLRVVVGVPIALGSPTRGSVHAAHFSPPHCGRAALKTAPLRFGAASRRPADIQTDDRLPSFGNLDEPLRHGARPGGAIVKLARLQAGEASGLPFSTT
jgi:hypothetical protein